MESMLPWALHSVYLGVRIECKEIVAHGRKNTKYRTWYKKNGKIGYIVYPCLEKAYSHINKIKEGVKIEVTR